MKMISQSSTWFSFVIAVVLILTSCTSDRSGMKPSTGKTNELLVVTNSEVIWKGKIGNKISGFFGQYLVGLPQPEKTFDMAHIPEPNFSQMFKTHHNIFIVDIDETVHKPILETHVDLWAGPQRIVKITVPDEQSFYTEFDLHKEAILELFNANERRRTAQAFGTIEDFKIKNTLKDDFDIDIMIPKNFFIAGKSDDFVWIRREAQQFSQGMMIYFYPYTDTIVFTPEHIMNTRDDFTKKFVPGPAEGSYMKISMIEPPISKRIDFNGNFAVEIRGLWDLEGDFMGGPFISYTMIDQRLNRVITIDGYVYYPNQEKKSLLRQMESIIYTLSFPENSEVAANK